MPEPHLIRVLIVDDHLMVRDGLKVFLSLYEDLQVVGEASSGTAALRLCGRLQPDVVLMDMVMPGLDGPTTTARLLVAYPHLKIIALTSFNETDLVQRAIEAGAIGFLHKDVHPERLAQAIRDAYRGRSTLDAAAAQALIEQSRAEPTLGADLTQREREVLALLVEGQTNKAIALALDISLATVRLHVSNILSKLNVSNRTEAVSLTLQNNLLG